MAKNNKTVANTDINEVKKQNEQGRSTEYASETNAQDVREQNAKSQRNKR